MVPPGDRFTTYKVKDLDWYDVESRIKLICNKMLTPIATIANDAKTALETQQGKLEKYSRDTEKLLDATFYRTRKHKNIFYVLQDQVNELKANEIQHEKTVTAQLESFGRSIEDMNFTIGNHQKAVDGFQSQLDMTRGQILKTQESTHKLLTEMQDKLTKSHTDLNRMFKEMVTRQNVVEKSYE